jgi:T4-like virus tail tube protein gp19
MPITSDKRGYTAGKFALDLDGKTAGWVQSIRGGEALSDVVEEKLAPGAVIKKHIAGVKYSDIEVVCGTGMSKSFYQWLTDTLDRKYSRKDGAVISADYDLKEQSRLLFSNALIKEIGFPALDAASKDPAKLTVKLSPEYTRRQKGTGGSVKENGYGGAVVQTKWLPSNFRLKIDGLDCTRVNKIEAFVIKQAIVENAVGEFRDYEKEPAHLEIPDLVITIAENNADDFISWHEDFVIKGNNGDDREKNGTLEFLTPNLQEVLFTIGFQHLGIYKLAPVEVQAGAENIRRLQAWMYCEQMTFAAPGAGGGFSATGITGTGAANGSGPAPEERASGGPMFVGDQAPGLVVVSGSNGPIVTEDIPDRFTRIRQTS